MSFILDALKKSEAERQRQAGPALLEMRVVRPQRRVPVWVIVAGATLLLINLGGMLWLLLKPATRPVAPAGAASAAASSPPPGGIATPVPERASPPVVPLQSVPDTGSGAGAQPDGAESAAGDGNPADYEPATQSGSVRTARDVGLRRSYNDVSNAVPPMRLDLHVFTAVPAQRYAFINMKKVREGETTVDGVKVVEITRDGVVLNYRDTEFLLTNESSGAGASEAPDGGSR